MAEQFLEGMEGTQVRAINYPTIGLAQALTPEVQRKVAGFKDGVIYATEFDENDNRKRVPLGDSVELVVYKVYPGVPRSKYNDRNDDDLPMFDCMSIDGKCGTKYGECGKCKYADFEAEDRCSTQSIFVVAPKSKPDNFKRLIFQKSSFNVGEKLKRLIATEARKNKLSATYEMSIILTSKSVENAKKKAFYNVFDVKFGAVIPEKERTTLKDNAEMVKESFDAMLEQFYENLRNAADDDLPGEPEVDAGAASAAAINALNQLALNKADDGSGAVL